MPVNKPDVVVLGCGVIGLMISGALADAGLSVLCVGRHSAIADTASGAAGAMLGAIGEVTADATGPLDRAETNFRLRSAALWRPVLRDLGSEAELRYGEGTFLVANHVNAQDLRNLAAAEACAESAGLRVESTDAADIPGMSPARHYEAVRALFLADEGWVDTGDLLRALHGRAASHPQITFEEDTVDLLRPGAPVSLKLATSGRTVTADHVVVAAGVGSGQLLAMAQGTDGGMNRLPKLLPGKGVSLLMSAPHLPALRHVVRTPNRDFACGTHVVPRGGTSFYLGATNRVSATPGAEGGATAGELHNLLHSAIHELNVGYRTATVLKAQHGARPLSSDGFPLIGATGAEGVLVATGTYRNGILMAPLIAKIVLAELQAGGEGPENPFSPVADWRQSRQNFKGPGELLEQGLQHLASFLLEPGGRMPYDRQRELSDFLAGLSAVLVDPSDRQRNEILRALTATPIPEVVPQVFYDIVESYRSRPT